MAYHRYTKELLQEAANRSNSVAGVLRELGLRPAGGTYSHITRRLKELEVDTSHFLGKAHARGSISTKRKTASEILVKRESGNRSQVYQLRRSLVEMGRPETCEGCGLGTSWNGKPLTLEVDHIDGEWLNDLAGNLRFLCPNCHSQCTETNKSWKNKPV